MRTRKVQLAEQADFHEQDIKAIKAVILDCIRAQDDISETIKTYRSGLDLMESQLSKRIDAIKTKCAERLVALEGVEPPADEADKKPRKTLTVVEPQQATV